MQIVSFNNHCYLSPHSEANGGRASSEQTTPVRLESVKRNGLIYLARQLLSMDIGNSHPTREELLQSLSNSSATLFAIQTLLNYLLDHPEDLNEGLGRYASPGHFAVAQKAFGLYRVLSSFHGFKKDLQDGLGNTHLHMAGQLLSEEIVDYILDLDRSNTAATSIKKITNYSQETPFDLVRDYANKSESAKRQRIMQKLNPAPTS